MIDAPQNNDGAAIIKAAESTGFFSQEEIDCVAELWQEYLKKGAAASGYHFLIDRQDGKARGFACYGRRALAEDVYDLYWIAVDKDFQGQGVGKTIIREVEKEIKELGGRLLIAETSGKPMYEPTRQFYHTAGYTHEATIKDFYREGEDLVIFTRKL